MMHKVHQSTITDAVLNRLIDRFVSDRDLYFFEDDSIIQSLLAMGIPIYTPSELARSFPTFSLEYGAIYGLWSMNLTEHVMAAFLQTEQLQSFDPDIQQRILEYQVKCQRGQLYLESWFDEDLPLTSLSVTVAGQRFYLLQSKDWWSFSADVQKRWILKWLREWHKRDEGSADVAIDGADVRLPLELLNEFAGTFADRSGPNCFAAAAAMAVCRSSVQNLAQARDLIFSWLHQEPFFRLLKAHHYSEVSFYRGIDDQVRAEPGDVLVWYTSDQVARHAAFAVASDHVFQKHGQGFENPWQILKIEKVWYNTHLETGGHVALFRMKRQ